MADDGTGCKNRCAATLIRRAARSVPWRAWYNSGTSRRCGRASAWRPWRAILVSSPTVRWCSRPEGSVVGRGHDQVEADSDLTSHAEILSIEDAVRHYGRSLRGCALVSADQEPCAMCFSAGLDGRRLPSRLRVVHGRSCWRSTLRRWTRDRDRHCRAQQAHSASPAAPDGGVLHSECLALWT